MTLLIAVPLHDGRLHARCVGGLLQSMGALPCRVDTVTGSYLPRSRDLLTARFLVSGASHMLCVDSDIGWTAAHATELLAAGKDVVSGVYCTKTTARDVPVTLDGTRDGDLLGASQVPAGFLLLSRSVLQRMWGHYAPTLTYESHGEQLVGLWHPMLGLSEDLSFCARARALDIPIWVAPRVVVSHHGEAVYRPNMAPWNSSD